MISWRTLLSIIFLVLLYALFLWESHPLRSKRPATSPPSPQFHAKLPNNDISLHSFGGAMAPFTQDHPDFFKRGIARRDVCNDTFPGRYQQTCEPSRTLCCIVPGAKLPGCNVIIGYGACCTENGGCYVDTSSSCGTPNAETCAPDICCPAQTNCIQNYNYTKGLLTRCSVDSNLVPGYSSSSSSASSTPTNSQTTTVVLPIETTTATRTTSTGTSTATGGTANSDAATLKGGQIAGIAIGAVAVAGLIGVAVFLVWRRRQRGKMAGGGSMGSQPQPQQQMYHGPQEMAADAQAQVHEVPERDGYWVDEYGRVVGGDGDGGQGKKMVYIQNGVGGRRSELPG